jgi:hypothetical protein
VENLNQSLGKNGIMEWWNDGFEKSRRTFFFLIASIPILHCSNNPVSLGGEL